MASGLELYFNDTGFNWKIIIRQTAILGLSVNDMFEMDLWQFVCYIEGYEARQKRQELSNFDLALDIAIYSAGSAYSKRKVPDANKQYDDIQTDIRNILIGNSKEESKKEEEERTQKELDLVKKQITRYKWTD